MHVSSICVYVHGVCVCTSRFSLYTTQSLCAAGREAQRSVALHYSASYQVEKMRTESGQMGPACEGKEVNGGMSRD